MKIKYHQYTVMSQADIDENISFFFPQGKKQAGLDGNKYSNE
jgi:hypothetical protein